MASIHKRRKKNGSSRWVVSFVDNHGRKTERVAGSTKKAAEALKVTIESQLADGTFGIRRDNPTFREFARRFLKVKKGTVKSSTYEFYSRTIDNYLLPYLQKAHVSEITPSRIQELLQRLADSGKSAATQAKALRALRIIMRWALTLELIERDPTLAIRAPKVSRKEFMLLNPPQFTQLLAACEGNLYILTAVAGMTGLRQGEIVALRWKDVDFENGVIRVMRNYFPGHGFSDLKSPSSRRAVPMVNTLKNILQSHWEAQEKPGEEELVVSNPSGTPLDRAGFTRSFKRVLEQEGLPDICFHDLRHFYASLGIAAGLDPKALQQAMGHSSIQVTMDVYGHLFPGSYDTALGRMDMIVAGTPEVVYLPKREGA